MSSSGNHMQLCIRYPGLSSWFTHLHVLWCLFVCLFVSFELHRLFTVVCGLSLVVAQRLSCPIVHGIKTLVQFLGWEDPLEKGKATHKSFSCGSAGKESPCNVGDLGLIPWVGKRGKVTHSSTPSWRIPWTVHGVAKSQTWLSDFHFIHNQGSNSHLLHQKVDS